MTSLLHALETTDALAEIFSDQSLLQAMLDVEAALARAVADAGVAPREAAEAIAAAARAEHFDAAALAREARAYATLAIPVVRALTDRVRTADGESASWVHWGATSQDVTDSALVLLLGRARAAVAVDHARLARTLGALSTQHARTVMLGRTLLQPAVPITFGLKAAGWYAHLVRAWARLDAAWAAALVVQAGGAAGTRAAWGSSAGAIADGLARQLGLAAAPPWHADRDRLGAFVAACGLYTAALAKMARDLALLMQAEVAEVRTPGGGSSAMPHKRNPAACVLALAAGTRVPGLVASFLAGMVQEHERAAGGQQAEWPTIAAVVQATGAAASAMADTLEGVTVDVDRMRANIEATRGTVLAEHAVVRLSRTAGRARAQAVVAEALQRAEAHGIGFVDALAEVPGVTAALNAAELDAIARPEQYLGRAEELRRQLLGD